jgi:hypothetical protein
VHHPRRLGGEIAWGWWLLDAEVIPAMGNALIKHELEELLQDHAGALAVPTQRQLLFSWLQEQPLPLPLSWATAARPRCCLPRP